MEPKMLYSVFLSLLEERDSEARALVCWAGKLTGVGVDREGLVPQGDAAFSLAALAPLVLGLL